jgi:hypothetical protein
LLVVDEDDTQELRTLRFELELLYKASAIASEVPCRPRLLCPEGSEQEPCREASEE